MTLPMPMSRRFFLAELGRGTVAIAVVGIAGCTPAASQAPSTARASASGGPTPGGASPATSAAGSAPPSDASSGVGDGVTWERVNLGFVSAYVLARGGEAAVVDTGTAGSEDDIAAALERISLGWDAVGHVIATHRHGDHAGSLAMVLGAATDATGYAGADDLGAIYATRPLVAVADGDEVFGLTIVATPGHTAGHIAVLDKVGGVLVAGDALGTSGGAVIGPNAGYTDDMATALASVAKLGTLKFDTLLVGHGDPIVGGASDLVAAFQPS